MKKKYRITHLDYLGKETELDFKNYKSANEYWKRLKKSNIKGILQKLK